MTFKSLIVQASLTFVAGSAWISTAQAAAILLPNNPVCYTQTETLPGGCIGGSKCGPRELRFDFGYLRPLESLSFYAHDRIGDRHEAKVNILLNNQLFVANLDIKKDGYTHWFNTNLAPVSSLAIVSVSDEAEIGTITMNFQVCQAPVDLVATHHGKCIGGARNQCQDRDILVLHGQGLILAKSIEFSAQDISPRRGGKFAVLVDGNIVAGPFDAPQGGRTYSLPLNTFGRRVEIQAVGIGATEIGTVTLIYSQQ